LNNQSALDAVSVGGFFVDDDMARKPTGNKNGRPKTGKSPRAICDMAMIMVEWNWLLLNCPSMPRHRMYERISLRLFNSNGCVEKVRKAVTAYNRITKQGFKLYRKDSGEYLLVRQIDLDTGQPVGVTTFHRTPQKEVSHFRDSLFLNTF
jgi:hypothetical protein